MFSKLISLYKPAPEIAPIEYDQDEQKRVYRYWRNRIMYTSVIGYSLFYFVRKNISIAMPAIESDLGISKTELGLFLTLHGLIYGLSKFLNGFLGDNSNPRWFMGTGLIMSALMSIFFGMSSGVIAFGVFWMLNGWFQGMGFPPCAKSIANWFSPSERGVKFSIWNSSHSIGAALVLILNSYLVTIDWRLCFFVPSLLAISGAFFIFNRLRDKPESLGLPPVEVFKDEIPTSVNQKSREKVDYKELLKVMIFKNPVIWVICMATFFVYTVRYVILDWGPTFLYEMRGIEIQHSGWMVAGYEVAGILGMLSSGWLMDRVFKGRGGRAALIYMLLCTVAIFLFWYMPGESTLFYTVLLLLIGFFIYGPQALVGIIVSNIVSKDLAATGIGLTGLFAYLSTILSGWGIGMIVTNMGWDTAFLILLGAGGAASLFFLLTWNTGYISKKNNHH